MHVNHPIHYFAAHLLELLNKIWREVRLVKACMKKDHRLRGRRQTTTLTLTAPSDTKASGEAPLSTICTNLHLWIKTKAAALTEKWYGLLLGLFLSTLSDSTQQRCFLAGGCWHRTFFEWTGWSHLFERSQVYKRRSSK